MKPLLSTLLLLLLSLTGFAQFRPPVTPVQPPTLTYRVGSTNDLNLLLTSSVSGPITPSSSVTVTADIRQVEGGKVLYSILFTPGDTTTGSWHGPVPPLAQGTYLLGLNLKRANQYPIIGGIASINMIATGSLSTISQVNGASVTLDLSNRILNVKLDDTPATANALAYSLQALSYLNLIQGSNSTANANLTSYSVAQGLVDAGQNTKINSVSATGLSNATSISTHTGQITGLTSQTLSLANSLTATNQALATTNTTVANTSATASQALSTAQSATTTGAANTSLLAQHTNQLGTNTTAIAGLVSATAALTNSLATTTSNLASVSATGTANTANIASTSLVAAQALTTAQSATTTGAANAGAIAANKTAQAVTDTAQNQYARTINATLFPASQTFGNTPAVGLGGLGGSTWLHATTAAQASTLASLSFFAQAIGTNKLQILTPNADGTVSLYSETNIASTAIGVNTLTPATFGTVMVPTGAYVAMYVPSSGAAGLSYSAVANAPQWYQIVGGIPANGIASKGAIKTSNQLLYSVTLTASSLPSRVSSNEASLATLTTNTQINPNRFANQIWAALGTSITNYGTYSNILAAKSGMFQVNLGVGASSIASSATTGASVLYNEINGIPTNAGVITLEAGTNDFRFNSTLGALGDTTRSTFYGALLSAITKIRARVPTALLFTTTPYGAADKYVTAKWNVANNNGNTYAQFAKAVREVSELTGTPVVDVGGKSGIGGLTIKTDMVDSLHLSPTGGERMAEFMWQQMKNYTTNTPTPRGYYLTSVSSANLSTLSGTGITPTGISISGSDTTITYSTTAGYSYHALWLGTGNAYQFTVAGNTGSGFWVTVGSGSLGFSGVGTNPTTQFTNFGYFGAGNGVVNLLTPSFQANPSFTAVTVGDKIRVRRVGTVVTAEKLVSGSWTTIMVIDLAQNTSLPASYYSKLQVGVLTDFITIKNVQVGTW